MEFGFRFPTDIHFGRGIVQRNSAALRLGARAFVVTGKRSGRASGALADVIAALTHEKIECSVFEGIGNNPDVEQCRAVGAQARAYHADFIIGIGGGSPLDAAKAVAVFAANDIPAEQLFTNSYENAVLPIVAVPTTSGTGSDGALAGSFDLIGHLLRCCGINGLRAVAFFPKGSGGDAFNVCTDEYAHGLPP